MHLPPSFSSSLPQPPYSHRSSFVPSEISFLPPSSSLVAVLAVTWAAKRSKGRRRGALITSWWDRWRDEQGSNRIQTPLICESQLSSPGKRKLKASRIKRIPNYIDFNGRTSLRKLCKNVNNNNNTHLLHWEISPSRRNIKKQKWRRLLKISKSGCKL